MADSDDTAFTFGDFNWAPPQSHPQPFQNGDAFSHIFFPQPQPDPARKPNGPTPSSFFGQINKIDSNGCLNSNPNVVGANDFDDIFGNFVDIPNKKTMPVNGPGLKFDGSGLKFDGSGLKFDGSGVKFDGSGLNSNDLVENGDKEQDDEWEFKGADFVVLNNLEEKDHSLTSGSKVVEMNQQKQAGQDASISTGCEPGPSNSLPQFVDLLSSHNGVDKSSAMDLFNFNSATVTTNGFTSSSFPGSKGFDKENEMSVNSVNEDDDFGDFVDAFQEVQPRGQEQILPPINTTKEQFYNETIQDKQIKQENTGGALPLSLFSDLTEESSDILEPQDNLIQKPVSYPANGFISQGSGISIHDLISNLYSQSHPTSPVVSSDKIPDENGVHFSPHELHSNPPVDDDDWDDNAWEFKDACSDTGLREQLNCQTPGNVSENPSETSSNLQFYIEFYGTMRETLCFLLSHLLKEKGEGQYSVSTIVEDGKVKAPGNCVQRAYKLLQDNMVEKEALSMKHLQASTCLDEVLQALQDPKLKAIESQYSLSNKLQLAANDWRVASELLRHVISVLHVLSLGSSDDHEVYVSTWSKLINVCHEELKYGALIWKRVSTNNLQHQILSDRRGLQNIQALGEIYKVVELVELSAKLYMPWMLLSVSPNIFGPLDECRTLWSSSGLEQIVQNISDNVDFGCYEPTKALIASIKNICDLDVVALHDLVFDQRKPLCRLSLLPVDMLAGNEFLTVSCSFGVILVRGMDKEEFPVEASKYSTRVVSLEAWKCPNCCYCCLLSFICYLLMVLLWGTFFKLILLGIAPFFKKIVWETPDISLLL